MALSRSENWCAAAYGAVFSAAFAHDGAYELASNPTTAHTLNGCVSCFLALGGAWLTVFAVRDALRGTPPEH